MARKKKIECRTCREPLRSQDSPLDFAAAKRGLCTNCYLDSVEMTIMHDRVNRMRTCEHLWNDWEQVSVTTDDGETANLFYRSCTLCKLQNMSIGPIPPPTPDCLDISWCDLERTEPEP